MPTVRIPLSWPYNPRTDNTEKDQRRVNVMDEILGERVFTRKRPGLTETYTHAAGVGQGITTYNGGVYSVIDDTLYVETPGTSGATGAAWTTSTSAPWLHRSDMGICNINGTIILIGGQNVGGTPVPLSDVWRFEPDQGWLQCTAAAPWAPRWGAMVGVIGTTLYFFGGTDGSTEYNDVWSSADFGVTWTQVTSAAAWSARFGSGTINADNGIYLLGGNDSSVDLNDVWFTTDGNTWNAVLATGVAAWSERHAFMTFYYPKNGLNALWVAGGQNFAGTATRTVYYSTDAGKTWTQSTSTAWTVGLTAAGALVYDSKMWVINGAGATTGSYTAKNDVWSSTDGVTWTLVTNNGPEAASYSGGVFVAPVPTSASVYGYNSMWWVGGVNQAGTPLNGVFFATLNVTLTSGQSLSTTPADQPMQFNSFGAGAQLLLKNQSDLWVIESGSIQLVTDDRYPEFTVPGIVVLGGYAYVMDPTGLIRNCALNDPYHWPLLNAVGADYESDPGVALVKYLNYVVAFGQYTTQFFYDAGVSPGSPLRPYLSANMKVGCANAQTVVSIGPTVYWAGRTQQYGIQIMVMNGLTPQVVSTPAEDKLLNGPDWDTDELAAFVAYWGGHTFYVISGSDGASLAYDLSTKRWYQWTKPDDSPFAYVGGTTTFERDGNLLLDTANGSIYTFSGTVYQDDGEDIPVEIITGRIDAENNSIKFWGPITLIGDRNVGEPLLQWTDDDYQTYNTGRTVNTEDPRPILYRNGASRRRAHKITLTNDQPLRWEALEQQYEQGNVSQGNNGAGIG